MFRCARHVVASLPSVLTLMFDASRYTAPVAFGDILAWRNTSSSCGPGPEPISGEVPFVSALARAIFARMGRRYIGFMLNNGMENFYLEMVIMRLSK